ncbi:hypothetical protein [Methylobrevis albus]|uniref:Uncharacterized protein n=1 Tax=Methylobrevis albus TaxID=2793297 RepID=A0A931I6P4_9HYPH|nr:hypothetical protein [Methylobrevis albus]MBH0239811.1 hypothetical protein [Methylobrevis albus]
MRRAVGYAVTIILMVVWLGIYQIWSNDLFQSWKSGFRFLIYDAENYLIGIFAAIGSILFFRSRFLRQDIILIIFFSTIVVATSYIWNFICFEINLNYIREYNVSISSVVISVFFALLLSELASFFFIAIFKFRAKALASFAMLVSWSIVIRILSIFALALSLKT